MHSLKSKITAVTVLCVFIACIILGSLCLFNVTQYTHESATQIMQASCQNRAADINQLFNNIEQSVNTLAVIVQDEISDLDRFKTNPEYVKECTDAFKLCATDFGLNTTGALTVYVRYNPEFTEPTSGLLLSRDNEDSEFTSLTPTDFSAYKEDDIEHVGWYYTPINNKTATWMDPYQNANLNVNMISYIVPIYINDTPVGVVGMDIDLSTIDQIVKASTIYSSGYTFLISTQNTIVSHPTLDFGTDLNTLQNEDLSSMLSSLSSTDTSHSLISYTYQHQRRLATHVTLKNGMKLIMTAPQSKIFQVTTTLMQRTLIGTLAAIIIAAICSIVLSQRLTAPLKLLTSIIKETAVFNFKPHANSKALRSLKDETGEMARAIHDMRNQLRKMVSQIDTSCHNLCQNLDILQGATSTVNEMCMDNSATTQELAAGMNQTAADTDNMTRHISSIQTGATEITTLSSSGKDLSQEVLGRAKGLHDKSVAAANNAQTIYASLKDKTNLAIESSSAIAQINELTNAITSISSETSLLALNASIEAARAGEAGKGFAVVASEIGSLAQDTANTAASINDIVQQVHTTVDHMLDCLKEASQFLENTVIKDYVDFKAVGKQYQTDATSFNHSMSSIYEAINALSISITQIANTLNGINSTVTESSSGIMDIANKTTQMVEKTQENNHVVSENAKSITSLKEIVSKFTLH